MRRETQRLAWRESSVVEQRARFAVLASRRQQPMAQLCAEFGISRQTGHLWLKRYQSGGLADLVDRSRRPKQSPARTAAELEEAVVEARQARPDWGAAKLARWLSGCEPPVSLQPRTVHRILERHGLIAPEDQRQRATQRFERSQPNELWQMDFKGPQGFNASIGPLSVMDDHSRYIVLLRHLASMRLELVQSSLTEIFHGVGMPESMLMDHGTPWWNANSPWGLTELSVWIMRLGIRLIYSGIRHPQTQGKVERMHGALQRAIGKREGDPSDQSWLDAFRHEYNHLRPHEALAMATPASIWKPSLRPFPDRLEDGQYAAGTHCFRIAPGGHFYWRGTRWEISRALRGQLVGVQLIGHRALVYFCRTPVRELDFEKRTVSPLLAPPLRFIE